MTQKSGLQLMQVWSSRLPLCISCRLSSICLLLGGKEDENSYEYFGIFRQRRYKLDQYFWYNFSSKYSNICLNTDEWSCFQTLMIRSSPVKNVGTAQRLTKKNFSFRKTNFLKTISHAPKKCRNLIKVS